MDSLSFTATTNSSLTISRIVSLVADSSSVTTCFVANQTPLPAALITMAAIIAVRFVSKLILNSPDVEAFVFVCGFILNAPDAEASVRLVDKRRRGLRPPVLQIHHAKNKNHLLPTHALTFVNRATAAAFTHG